MMKKLGKKAKVYPSLAPAPAPAPSLSFLPAAIVTLAATLSPEDKEVLAYLISFCGSNNNNTADNFSQCNKTIQKSNNCVDFPGGCVGGSDGDHEAFSDCNCFRCYMSFWARWDASPNRQLIHEIIEAYEEGLFRENNSKRSLKRKKKGKRVCDSDELKINGDKGELGSVEVSCGGRADEDRTEIGGGEEEDSGDQKMEPVIKGSVKKIVSFLGEKIWAFLE